ncbi:hypothetical protein [Pseudofrankia sp. DC12]|uniref:hypothetical protein n=1 Tax=Pseudofrankia sp. DC12 TaxID=683315 RepID=UPI000AD2694E|nr:hypothetical protein [Pseudofrankia sp. DC12]
MAFDLAAGPARAGAEDPGDESGARTAARLDALLADVDASADPRLRALAHELVRTLMLFYGAGLDRVAALVPPATLRRLADDDLVGGLLALHDLHPDGITPEAQGHASTGPPQPDGRRVLPLTVVPARPRVAAVAPSGAGP